MLCWALCAMAQAAAFPTGLYLIGLDASLKWRVLGAVDGKAVPIDTQIEPREAAIDSGRATLAYVGADGALRLRNLAAGSERVLMSASAKVAYTQPAFSSDPDLLYFVEMKDGKSVDTELIEMRLSSGAQRRVAIQPGAQFEPFVLGNRWLVYSSVSCSEGCPALLEEIWVKNLIGDDTRQITLLNALSREPATDGRIVVFSSNAGGGRYALWQVGIDGTDMKRLDMAAPVLQKDGTTSLEGNDISPALLPGGRIAFIRSSPKGTSVLLRSKDGVIEDITPPGIRAVRSLRVLP